MKCLLLLQSWLALAHSVGCLLFSSCSLITGGSSRTWRHSPDPHSLVVRPPLIRSSPHYFCWCFWRMTKPRPDFSFLKWCQNLRYQWALKSEARRNSLRLQRLRCPGISNIYLKSRDNVINSLSNSHWELGFAPQILFSLFLVKEEGWDFKKNLWSFKCLKVKFFHLYMCNLRSEKSPEACGLTCGCWQSPGPYERGGACPSSWAVDPVRLLSGVPEG